MEEKFPIRPVLEYYTDRPLPHRAGWAKMLCVVHEDSTPSASFREDKEIFHCFTCGFTGDALDIIQAKEGNTWHEALEMAKAITGQEGGFVKEASRPAGRCRPVRIGDLAEGGAPRPRTSGTTTKTVGRKRPRRIT